MSKVRSNPSSRGGMHRGPGPGMIGEKPKDFKKTFKRLISYLKPWKNRMILLPLQPSFRPYLMSSVRSCWGMRLHLYLIVLQREQQ